MSGEEALRNVEILVAACPDVIAWSRTEGAITMETIERIETPSSSEFLARYASPGKPVIIVDAMREWRCRRLWADDYLTARLRGRRFLVSRTGDGAFGIFSSRMHETDTFILVTFDELLDLVRSASADPRGAVHYLQQKRIEDTFPELVTDVEYVDFIDRAQIRDVNLWFSQRRSRIPLHFDTFDNLLAQVRGVKRVRLFAPRQSRCLYAGRDGAEFASKVDLEQPDLERYPRFAAAEIDADIWLEEGEMLFLPAYWWHYVTTESASSLSINYWYHLVHGSPRQPLATTLDLCRIALRQVQGLPPPQRLLAVEQCRQLLDELARSQ